MCGKLGLINPTQSMLTYTRSQILAAPKGSVIPAVKVTVTKLFDRKSGQAPDKYSQVPGAMRVWSMQSGKCLVDGIGGRAEEVAIIFDGYDEMGAMVGKSVLIESTDKGKGFHGVTADDNVYKGTTTRQIKVTKAAKIGPAYDDQGGDPNTDRQTSFTQGDDPAPQQSTPVAPQGRDVVRGGGITPPPHARPAQSHPATSVGAAKLYLNRLANLYILCSNAATYALNEGGIDPTDGDQLQKATACLFIQATRDGLAMSMPTGKLEADVEPTEDLPLGASPVPSTPQNTVKNWLPEDGGEAPF